MNIFVLDENLSRNAAYHCDKHVLKMIIEHTQMLATCYYDSIGIQSKKQIQGRESEVERLFEGFPRKKNGITHPYGISHFNHPCTKWVRESEQNFNWLLDATIALCKEYTFRWNKKHSIENILEWMLWNPPIFRNSGGLTEHAKIVPECFLHLSPIDAYRSYYGLKSKLIGMTWKNRENPHWYTHNFINECIELYEQTKELQESTK